MAMILIAENERAIAQRMAVNLRLVGHRCDQAANAQQALESLRRNVYDLVLLDLALPGVGGFAGVSRFQAQPVLLLVTESQMEVCPAALHRSCLVKPFEVMELMGAVQQALGQNDAGREFRFHDIEVDMAGRQVLRGGHTVALTPQEYSLLETLVLNRNLALSRTKLLEIAWGYGYQGATRTVDVHIQRLRRKLGLEKEIQTVYKIGYRLNTRGEAGPV